MQAFQPVFEDGMRLLLNREHAFKNFQISHQVICDKDWVNFERWRVASMCVLRRRDFDISGDSRPYTSSTKTKLFQFLAVDGRERWNADLFWWFQDLATDLDVPSTAYWLEAVIYHSLQSFSLF